MKIPVSRELLISAFEAPVGNDVSADVDAWLDGVPEGERPDTLKPAAVLIPLIDHADGMTVLLTQRTAHLTAHAGQISFPDVGAVPGKGQPRPGRESDRR